MHSTSPRFQANQHCLASGTRIVHSQPLDICGDGRFDSEFDVELLQTDVESRRIAGRDEVYPTSLGTHRWFGLLMERSIIQAEMNR